MTFDLIAVNMTLVKKKKKKNVESSHLPSFSLRCRKKARCELACSAQPREAFVVAVFTASGRFSSQLCMFLRDGTLLCCMFYQARDGT